MKVKNRKVLLFIEPTRPASSTPVDDEYTRTMRKQLDECKVTGWVGFNGSFSVGSHTLGVHTCVCGERSKSYDFQIEDGYVTNGLAAHYLERHRDEIPPSEWKKLNAWLNHEELPSSSSFTLAHLKKLAKEQKIPYYSKLTKEELIDRVELN